MVNPVHEVHPLGSLRDRLGGAGVEVLDAVGCTIHRTLPPPRRDWITDATIDYFVTADDMNNAVPPLRSEVLPRFNLIWPDDPSEGLTRELFACRVSFGFTPDVSGVWSFGLTSIGRARLFVDGELVADDEPAAPGGSFFGIGKAQFVASHELLAGQAVRVTVEYVNDGLGMMRGLIMGFDAPVVDDLVAEAARLAATTDASIVIVGTNDDWEAEGYDRTTIALPGRQDELISEVAKVSARTIVVVNAGSPVAMPWINEVDAVLFVWFPGQEFGDALTDVLLGDVDPGGRLPVTLPRRLEDTPAFEHHPGRNGVGRYLEGRLIGYRYYDTVGREPLFGFGHGLSYADISIVSVDAGDAVVRATVTNAGDRSGFEVIQVYAHDPVGTGAPDDAVQQLVGFAKIELAAGESRSVEIALDPRWAMHWDVATHSWATRPGARELRVGRSSRRIDHVLAVTVG